MISDVCEFRGFIGCCVDSFACSGRSMLRNPNKCELGTNGGKVSEAKKNMLGERVGGRGTQEKVKRGSL